MRANALKNRYMKPFIEFNEKTIESSDSLPNVEINKISTSELSKNVKETDDENDSRSSKNIILNEYLKETECISRINFEFCNKDVEEFENVMVSKNVGLKENDRKVLLKRSDEESYFSLRSIFMPLVFNLMQEFCAQL